jgi:hypothetical protein
MRFNLRVIGLLSLVLVGYTNCSNYQEPQVDNLASLVNLSCDDDCITPTTDNLKITPHLGGSGTEYSVPANLVEFNIGGDCNEGGYPYNMIRWELQLNGVKKRDSGMIGMLAKTPTANVNSMCVNGRFLLYVNLKAITEDNVNRQGLSTGATRAPYDLYIEIYGKKTSTDTSPVRNTLKGRTRVSLLPI